jgi:uncharacterized surface protein with fasciclin (FAS1) repeats
MVVPVILVLVTCVLILLLVISQTGIFDPVSSLGSILTSDEQVVVPAQKTPVPASPVPTGAPTLQTTMIPAQAISTPTPTPVTTVSSAPPSATVTTSIRATASPTVTSGASTSPGGLKNILATLEADGRFTTFVAAVKAAELDSTLSSDTMSGTEMFTVFAPTDDAFNQLSEGSMDTFLKDPQGDLLQILLYHVIPGKVTAADLKKLTSVETLQGGALPISTANGIMMAGGANVIITDIECSNGVIHVVDTIMLPPA